MLQTYFTAGSHIDYFVVVEETDKEEGKVLDTSKVLPTDPERACFGKLEEDYLKTKDNITKQARIVQDFGDSRLARVSWLEHTDFLFYLGQLKNEEVLSLYKLLSIMDWYQLPRVT